MQKGFVVNCRNPFCLSTLCCFCSLDAARQLSDGIHVLSGFPSQLGRNGTTIGELMRAHFVDDSWPSASALILRVQQSPGDVLNWNDVNVRFPGKALICPRIRASCSCARVCACAYARQPVCAFVRACISVVLCFCVSFYQCACVGFLTAVCL